MKLRWLPLLLGLTVSCATASLAQTKKNLPAEEWTKWQSLAVTDISPNGQWTAYQITVQEDNDTMYLVNQATGKNYKLPFASSPSFSKDNQWLAYRIGVSFKEAERAREAMRPIEAKMGLINLNTGKIEEVKNISRFSFSRDGRHLAVYLAPPRESRDKGSVLLLKNLADGTTRTIGNVTEFAFNKKADHIAYIIESANTAGNTLELYNLATGNLKVLASDTARFAKLTWSKEGDGLAFFRAYRKDGFEEDNAVVYTYTNLGKTPVMKVFDPEKEKNFPQGMRVYNASNLSLSDDNSSVFFGLKPWTYNELAKKNDKRPGDAMTAKDSARIDSTRSVVAQRKGSAADKLAGVEIWHWKDPEIQPRQKITLGQDTILSALSAWNLDNNSFVNLTTEDAPLAQLTGNQKYAVVYTSDKYKPAFKEDFADAYIVNVKTGERKLAFEKTLTGFYTFPRTSPDGKFLIYFKDKHWWSYNIATGQNLNLTQNISSDFSNVRDDHPATRPPVGMGGWTKGDKEVLLYDEYDIWAVKPDGKGARKLTDGKKDEVMYRVVRTNFEEPAIDDTKPMYFSMYGDKTKKYGYARMNGGKVQPLVFEDMAVNRLLKAENADAFVYVKQRYDQSPSLYYTNNFNGEKLVANTNKQQEQYKWGKSELITYTNADGKQLQGALFYPADYEPGKKYPMITYIYEELSSTVHNYVAPNPRSAYNTTNYTTNGYFVFRPDIVYTINDPGMSAVKCVVPAVREVLKTGMIDSTKLGLMGHSWGAYQTSFIITQTNLFKAAIAGAPLTNLISMSNSIYWNTGTPDAKIFETSQGRFDGPWYERMEEHMRNSPMYQAANIKTPLLVAFGDKDGAVDWHQGIEMYSTMRRMQKPHIMLVYADENHGLAKKENQIDYQRRQKEYFDHYILGKPAPKWITEGMSQQEKAKQKAGQPAAGAKVF